MHSHLSLIFRNQKLDQDISKFIGVRSRSLEYIELTGINTQTWKIASLYSLDASVSEEIEFISSLNELCN